MRMAYIRNGTVGGYKGCQRCGGMLQYSIEKKKLVCQRCSQDAPVEEYNDVIAEEESSMMDVLEYCCPQCGAAVHTTQTNMVSYCNFCGSAVMFSQRMTSTKRPEKIVPFKITRERCEEIYWKRIKGGRFIPDDIKEPRLRVRFQPVYVPFYHYREVYEGETDGSHVVKTTTSDYYITETYSVQYYSKVDVQGELHCASSQMEPEVAEKLMFSLDGAVAFQPGYLSGFFAEAPDMEDNRYHSGLRKYARTKLIARLYSKVSNPNLPKKEIDDVEVVLLPVWLLAERQDGRMVYTAINGVDGTMVCDTPADKKKTLRFAGMLAVLFALLFYLLFSWVIVMPKLVAAMAALMAAAGYYMVNHALERNDLRESQRKKDRQVKAVKLNHSELVMQAENEKNGSNGLASFLLSAGGLIISFLIMLGAFKAEQIGFGFLMLCLSVFCFVMALNKGIKLFKNREYTYTIREWLMIYGIPFAVIGAVIYGLCAMFQYDDALVAGAISDRGWLAPYLLICSVYSMYKYRFTRVDFRDRDNLLYWAELALVVMTGVLCLFVHNQVVYYIMAMAMMLLLGVSFLRLLLRHNEYVTRPVPYFGRKEETK